MTRFHFFFFLCFTLSGCHHPEAKEFELNKGSQTGFNIRENQVNYNSDDELNTSDGNKLNFLSMEIENGVRYVWIEVNGIRLRFIFDTGASSICISPAEATVLYRQGTLSKEDILDVEYFQDATGGISEGTQINLREVKIGNLILENVRATVVYNVNAPLLLGQTVLERFGKIEIDNENQEIVFR